MTLDTRLHPVLGEVLANSEEFPPQIQNHAGMLKYHMCHAFTASGASVATLTNINYALAAFNLTHLRYIQLFHCFHLLFAGC